MCWNTRHALVSRWEKTRERIREGQSDQNIRYDNVVNMLRHMGFKERQRSGSHHIFTLAGVEEIINIQALKNGMAKDYQIRQVRTILEIYGL